MRDKETKGAKHKKMREARAEGERNSGERKNRNLFTTPGFSSGGLANRFCTNTMAR